MVGGIDLRLNAATNVEVVSTKHFVYISRGLGLVSVIGILRHSSV